ncbi:MULTISPECIES: hypothetical protein [unclassified Sphingopyxis]|uniref:hypothetical protein n=1 Tax=unclassified Sphingopyxis TaxID=2614943 RepID=UPI0012E36007|nr:MULTISPECIES: hypothetical protein [unclassified Sphingopyxis]
MAADVGKYGGNGKRGGEHRYPIDAQHILSRHSGLDPGSRFFEASTGFDFKRDPGSSPG